MYIRADLHGDLKSLLENLRTLQQEGYLDDQFRCKEGTHLVFLGDYADRGSHSCHVLEILAALKIENPDRVFLIRGNHEALDINFMYGRNDQHFMSFLEQEKNTKALNNFYMRMPLTLYMAQEGEKKEYIQFTHGLFELYVDPAEILDTGTNQMNISNFENKSLSGRVKNLAEQPKDSPLKQAAAKIHQLAEGEDRFGTDVALTSYNWGDVYFVQVEKSFMGSLGYRKWMLTPEDIKNYLMVSSAHHEVKVIFRGHQHKFQHHTHNGELVATTLPVGMDSSGYRIRVPNQEDRAYILTPASCVEGWQKQAFLRTSGDSTTTLSESKPLQSTDI